MTPAEAVLWEVLRDRQLRGLKFRRIEPICGLYADFFCSELNLVIEVDGEIHRTQEEYDAERTKVLGQLDLRVLRFRNEEVLHDLPSVLSRILEHAPHD
jgi:very-short-patch-repair endonuclease